MNNERWELVGEDDDEEEANADEVESCFYHFYCRFAVVDYLLMVQYLPTGQI